MLGKFYSDLQQCYCHAWYNEERNMTQWNSAFVLEVKYEQALDPHRDFRA